MTNLNYAQRKNLKAKIEADLELLIDESSDIDIRSALRSILAQLKTINYGFDHDCD